MPTGWPRLCRSMMSSSAFMRCDASCPNSNEQVTFVCFHLKSIAMPKPNDRSEDLPLEQRRRRIRGLMEQRAQVTVTELARQFAVSAVTGIGGLAGLDEIGGRVRGPRRALPPCRGVQTTAS